jgi:hypothetical protein
MIREALRVRRRSITLLESRIQELFKDTGVGKAV